MSKNFAKAFYRGHQWQACRDAYIGERIAIDGGICEQCGDAPGEELHHKIFLRPANIHDPDITLNPDNLIWLCRECHFAIHKAAVVQALKNRSRGRVLKNGLWFDAAGAPHPLQVKIVYGAPCSGKTSFVREHMEVGDLVVDLDAIRTALSFTVRDADTDNLLGLTLRVRELLYEMISERAESVDCHTVWVVAQLPEKREREALQVRLRGELVPVLAEQEECLRRALADEEREDKLLQRVLIERWFERFEA